MTDCKGCLFIIQLLLSLQKWRDSKRKWLLFLNNEHIFVKCLEAERLHVNHIFMASFQIHCGKNDVNCVAVSILMDLTVDVRLVIKDEVLTKNNISLLMVKHFFELFNIFVFGAFVTVGKFSATEMIMRFPVS